MSGVKVRDSNIELMRIVIMFFIVFLHFITNAELLSNGTLPSTFFHVNTIRGFLLVAVNCFVLISGYYGIKFKIKGLLSIYLTVLIYGAIGYFLHLFIDDQHIGRSILYNTIFCISNSKMWFIPCYFSLYCISPILNSAIAVMTKKQYLYSLITLTIIVVYFGWFWEGRAGGGV